MVISSKLPASSRRHKGHFDRGAAAVEMALVLPVLLFLLMGMIDFGRAYSAQIQLSQAAREGVRLASMNTGDPNASAATNPYGSAAIIERVQQAAGGVSGVTATTTFCDATTPTTASVVVRAPFVWITGISAMSQLMQGNFVGPTTMQSKGVMRCAG